MRRKAMLVGVVATVAIAGGALVASPAAATAPEPVQITGPIASDGTGTFTAIGPVCPSGTNATLLDQVVSRSGKQIQILVVHEFTCDDGSGSFQLSLQVHLVFQPFSDTFTWTVLSGTGAYEKLHGTGTGSGVPTDTGIVDSYTGAVHVD